VYLFPTTGRVLVRKLKRLNNDTIATRERSYSTALKKVETAQAGGDIELFA
jgi:chemotaxis protein CheD